MDEADRRFAERMARELAEAGPVTITIPPAEVLHVAGMLQLAGRHPGVSAEGRKAIADFLELLRAELADCPATLELLRRGDDPREDRRR